MSSSAHGIPTSEPEGINVSVHGLWLLGHGKEWFLSYVDLPRFKDALISKVTSVDEVSPGHYFWPDLDIDLGMKTIENPEKYPLKVTSERKQPSKSIRTPAMPAPMFKGVICTVFGNDQRHYQRVLSRKAYQ